MRTNDVTGNEVAGFARHLVILVSIDEAAAIVERSQIIFKITALADCGNQQVAIQFEIGAFNGGWLTAVFLL